MKNPLTIKTSKVVKVLKDALKSQKNAWDEAEQAKADKVAGAAALAAEFVAKYPAIAAFRIEYYYGINFSNYSTLEDFEEALSTNGYKADLEDNAFGKAPYKVAEFPGNTSIEKLIRTLELAEDETIEVSPTDEIYPLI